MPGMFGGFCELITSNPHNNQAKCECQSHLHWFHKHRNRGSERSVGCPRSSSREVTELEFEPRTVASLVLRSCCPTRQMPASSSRGCSPDWNGLSPGPQVPQPCPLPRAECICPLSLPLINPSEAMGDLNGTPQSQALCAVTSVTFPIPTSHEGLSSVLQTPHSRLGPP